MFIYYFVHLDKPFQQAQGDLIDLLDGMSEAADISYRQGEHLLAKARPYGPVIAKTVRLSVGAPIYREEECTVPLRWEATGTPGLFPRLDADLSVASVGPHLSKLSLQGSYQPPLGAIGRALDRAILHRVAEATIKHFVERVAAAIVGQSRLAHDRVL